VDMMTAGVVAAVDILAAVLVTMIKAAVAVDTLAVAATVAAAGDINSILVSTGVGNFEVVWV